MMNRITETDDKLEKDIVEHKRNQEVRALRWAKLKHDFFLFRFFKQRHTWKTISSKYESGVGVWNRDTCIVCSEERVYSHVPWVV